MPHRAEYLIASLQLQPHPEGGWYREDFRSVGTVQPGDGRKPRNALTSIYFLLTGKQVSRWHRVLSDEVWVHLEGDPLALWTWDAEQASQTPRRHLLGPIGADAQIRPQHVVPAGQWQAALPWRDGGPGGNHVLLACMVGPGFDFADFSLLADVDAAAAQLRARHPSCARWI